MDENHPDQTHIVGFTCSYLARFS